jgi:uncharacterized membrane protein YhhN
MFNAWFFLLLLAALADWYCVYSRHETCRFVTKPLVLLLLIAWFTTSGGWQHPGGLLFGIALVFSLLGDIFLLNKLVGFRPVFFQVGLLAFLVAQVAYIIAFNLPFAARSLLILLPVTFVAGVGYFNAKGVIRQMGRTPEEAAQVPPVVVYMVALSLMVASAWSTVFRADWLPAGALLAALGASLFYISDSLIAHDKFGSPIPSADLILTITYHLGQLGIIAGVLSGL